LYPTTNIAWAIIFREVSGQVLCLGHHIQRNEWAGHVLHLKKRQDVHQVYVGSPEGNKPLGNLTHVWAFHIRMHIKETVWENAFCIHLVQAVLRIVTKRCVPKLRGIY
jgi:hypothetical protein